MPRIATIVAALLPLCSGTLRADDLATLFQPADHAFAAGNFDEGDRLLEDLVASRPGDFEFAGKALHRACLANYFRLIATDWPSGNMPAQLLAEAGAEPARIWPRLSEYLEEAILETGKFAPDGETYTIPVPKILESLWRRRADYPLSPLQNISDNAAQRILTLHRLGHLDDDDPAVIDASIWLLFLRKNQKRLLEATRLVDHLADAKNQQVSWRLAQARHHAETNSPRAEKLIRELYTILDHPTLGAQPEAIRAKRRAEGLKDPATERLSPHPLQQPAGPGWLGQMAPDNTNPSWERLADGLVNGIEEPIHLWIQETFSQEQSRAYMKRLDGAGSAMAWSVIDHHLRSIGPEHLKELAKLQEEYSRLDARANGITHAEPHIQLAFYRAYPWAHTAHTGLLAFAKAELEDGRGQSAYSAFQDILGHSADPALRKQAQVGLWVAMAMDEHFGELAASIAAATGDETYPWLEGQATAKDIHNRLLQAIPGSFPQPDTASPLAELTPQVLKLPAQALWPQMNHRRSSGLELVQLQTHRQLLLASTRNLLAAYDAKTGGNPLWTHQCGGQWNKSIGRPGPSRPIIKGDRIYTRWGYEADPQFLVALDIQNRDILWSVDTAGPADAKRKIPLGNPVLCGAQIYIASGWDRANARGGYNFRLSSIDASQGTVNWHADINILRTGRHPGNNTFEGVLGDCITVHKGKLYCSPGTGFLAKFDAKDGRMEWMYNYESNGLATLQEDTLGSAPLLVDSVVVALPRDSNTIVGLDPRTGNILWRSPALLPQQLIGVYQGTVLLRGHSAMAALDARTGQVLWHVAHPDKMLGQATLQGASLHLASARTLYRFDAATGIRLESRPQPTLNSPIRYADVEGDRLRLITDEPSSGMENPFLHKAPGGALWEIRANNPRIYHPDNNEPGNGTLLIHQDEVLHCLDAAGTRRILWQRFLYPAPNQVYFVQDKVVLAFHHGQNDLLLKALRLDNGNQAWERKMHRLRAGHGAMYGRAGHLLYGRDNTDGFHLVDLDTGEILRQSRIDRRNGTARGGLGADGQLQFMVAAYNKSLFWFNWNAQSNELEGASQVLRGAHGDPGRPFDDVVHLDAHFGTHAGYFVCNQNGQFAAYRADYRDRSIHLLRQGARNLKFQAPFLLFQDGDAPGQKHRWTIHREDDPAYAHSLDLAHTWQGQSTFVNGHLLEILPSKPPSIRMHNLNSRKTIIEHAEKGCEKIGALPAGEDHVIVYAYQRHKRDTTDPFFRLTAYDLKTGQQRQTQEIGYWNDTNRNPDEIRVVGNLLIARNQSSIRAWQLEPSLF